MASHFKTLMWKHAIFCKRHKVKTAFFFLTPLLLILIVFITVSRIDANDIPECSYQTTSLLSNPALPFIQGILCGNSDKCRSYKNYQPHETFARLPNENDTFLCPEAMKIAKQMAERCEKPLKSDAEYGDIGLDRLLTKGQIYFYPNNPKHTLANSIVREMVDKLNSLSKLKKIATDFITQYNNTKNNISVQTQLPQLLYLYQHFEIIVTALSCFPDNNTDRFKGFADEEEAMIAAKKSKIESEIVWGIVGFDKQDTALVKYKLSSHTGFRSSIQTLQLQSLVESAIIKYRATEPFPMIEHELMPRKCRRNSTIYLSVSGIIQLVLCFGFIVLASALAGEIAYEKAFGLLEFLLIVGLSKKKIYASWWVFGMTFFAIIGLFLAVSLKLLPKELFKATEFSLILLLMILFALSYAALTFLVAFALANPQRTTIALLICSLAAYLGPSFAGLTAGVGYTGSQLLAVRGFSLLSPVAAVIGITYLCEWEKVGEGATWNRLTDSPANNDSFRGLGEAYFWLLFDTFLYLLLAIYFDKISPGKYGVKFPFYFCCLPTFWRCSHQDSMDSITSAGKDITADIEMSPAGKKPGIQINRLTKEFGKGKIAVNSLSATFYKGDITALLGHNGAGKSTTMNILTGMTTPSSGLALLDDRSILKDMQTIRKSLGYCPQYDILYLDLSVQEHMQFFGQLKGLSKDKVDSYAETLFKQIAMPSSAMHTSARSLSGGMKRKLSIAIAFLGDPSTVILDEPTSAIDPFSRRAIWDVILSYRSKSTILISTHYMQEADILGDRIAVINKGELKCCGSSMYLKGRYGNGACLTIAHHPDLLLDDLTHNLNQFVPLQLVNTASSECSFRIPTDSSQSQAMVDLLEYLEQNQTHYGIQSFGISEATLDQVFFHITEENETAAVSDQEADKQTQEDNSTNIDYVKLKGFQKVVLQFWACWIKRFHLSRKSIAALVFQLITPLLFAFILFVLTNRFSSMEKKSEGTKLIHPWVVSGNKSNNFFYAKNINSTDPILSSLLKHGIAARCTNGSPLEGLTCISATPVLNENAIVKETYIPCDCARKCPTGAEGPSPNFATLSTGDILINLEARNVTNYLLKTNLLVLGGVISDYMPQLSADYFTRIGQSEAKHMGTSSINEIWLELDAFMTLNAPQIYLKVLAGVAERSERSKNEAEKNGELMKEALLNAINNAVLRASVNGATNDGIILTSEERQLKMELSDLKRASGIMLAMFGMYAFLMPILAIVLVVVTERASGCKQLQILMGLSRLIYWLSTFAWDLVLYMISICLVLLLMAVASKTFAIDLLAVSQVAFLYGLSMILTCYVLSFSFKTGRNAVLFVAMVAVVLNIAAIVLSFWKKSAWYSKLNLLLNCLPPYYVSDCLLLIGTFEQIKTDGENLQDMEFLGERSLFCLKFCSTMIIKLILCEFRVCMRLKTLIRDRYKRSKTKIVAEDDILSEERRCDRDVRNEAEEVLRNAGPYAMAVKNLSKTFANGKQAVKGVSFGVKRGESFGLLGANGAGKSTLFKMLTRYLEPSGGDACIRNQSIFNKGNSTVSENMSYCPQEDILYEALTPYEHLAFFARIRGIPGTARQEMINSIIRDVGLDPHVRKRSDALSGGNKRKLSFAIALLDYPAVIFLDEMTTGMDPRARQSAWKALSQAVTKRGCASVITSHSMEECEALCNRIVIMVNGQFHCIGSIQYLKDKFGNNYTVKFRYSGGDSARSLFCSIQNTFPRATILEEHPAYLEIQLPGEKLHLSVLYQRIFELHKPFNIEEFSVSQTTLEHIFVQLVGKQE